MSITGMTPLSSSAPTHLESRWQTVRGTRRQPARRLRFRMDVAIIGAGYVGLVTGAGLAHLGHRVRVGEADPQRVERLQSGVVPIFEDGLPALLASARERGLISFHTSNKDAV